ncbi:hypothetical protein O181_119270 [Austropuccinia psidii MF-1]|uniref:Uncharacterized protein n=1 Tax=Austropuccinia psidii MF-1 TaxID=1389203 RepID=A0A9Q3KDR0_9BASI|nr:hypothetical protein [Austropuccinia psidii MF-1]
MIPPHFKDFGFPMDYLLQRESAIRRNRGLERREVEVVQSHNKWQNEPYYTFQDGFQQKTSKNGLHRTVYSKPSNLQRTSPVENGRQGIQPRVPLERICRNLIRSGNPTKLPSGFTSLRHQQISDQKSPYFPIPGRIRERKRIIGQEQNFFQPKEERVGSYHPELLGPAKRSTKKTVVNTSSEASSPRIRNNISTQIKHDVVIPESTIIGNTLWLQFSQFAEQTQNEFERLHENISGLQEVNTLQTKTIHILQEDYTRLSKSSEKTKRRLNQVLEEQNNCKRDMEYLNQDIDKLLNVCQNIKPQTQGNVLDIPYHQEDIKPDALLENKTRSPSK